MRWVKLRRPQCKKAPEDVLVPLWPSSFLSRHYTQSTPLSRPALRLTKNNSFRSHHIYNIKVMTNRTQCLYALLNTSIKFSFIASTLEVYRNDFDLVSKRLCMETDQKPVRFWKLFSQTVFQKLISLSVLINLLPVLAICTFFCICYVIEMILHCLNWFFYISVNLFTIFVKCLNLAKICDRVPLNANRKGKVR